ncbi:hypothetical protein HS088_TW08G00783 [Tripterygium wilfordii]|uniref:Uncharacterized protein n=1 Tax=Tripterygium wilfordii TaxID=458696 RepID=A0A7J7DCW2_TRIWF|nr:hypothetical protein HS088_TW08G00783 [Tripterygium wilfordii]
MSMEKKRSSSRPNDGCGKIFRAVTPCCHHNDSPHRSSPTRTQVPLAADTVDPAKAAGKHGNILPAEVAAANMENKPPPSVHKALKTDSPNRRPKAQISGEVNKHEGKKIGSRSHSDSHIEDRFTDYINRAKVKIRTTSNAGEAAKVIDKRHSTTKVDKTSEATKADKTFSEYINRAKLKIRAMSGSGGGKHDSSK